MPESDHPWLSAIRDAMQKLSIGKLVFITEHEILFHVER